MCAGNVNMENLYNQFNGPYRVCHNHIVLHISTNSGAGFDEVNEIFLPANLDYLA